MKLIIKENERIIQEEFNNNDELIELILSYTDYFTVKDDDMSNDLIEARNFDGLAQEISLCYGGREPYSSNGKKYCNILKQIYNSDLKNDRIDISELNLFLKENNLNLTMTLGGF